MTERQQSRVMADDHGIYGIGLAPAFGHNSGDKPVPLILLDIDVLDREMLHRLLPQQIRRDELLAAAERFHEKNAIIETDDLQQRATDFVRQMKACSRAIEDVRKFEKQPVLNAQRAIDNLFATFVADLLAAITAVEAKMTVYARAKVLMARRLAEQEARKLREEAAEAERLALSKGIGLDAAIVVSQAADDAAARAASGAAALSRVHSDLGGVASLRATVRYRVVNIDAVPRRYLKVDEDAVKLAGKGWREKDPQPITGIEFFLEEKVTVR